MLEIVKHVNKRLLTNSSIIFPIFHDAYFITFFVKHDIATYITYTFASRVDSEYSLWLIT